jgi:hypothetical protein
MSRIMIVIYHRHKPINLLYNLTHADETALLNDLRMIHLHLENRAGLYTGSASTGQPMSFG